MPAEGSDTVVIVSHPRFFSRSGLPSHLEHWRSMSAGTGNDFEVDLVPDITILHEAGYHVLAYDLRNFGHSGAANGRLTSSGRFESRDVIGSLRYVRGRPGLHEAKIALFSRCLGADATLFAMERAPRAFAGVRCLVACQPLSPRMVVGRGLERGGIPAGYIEEIDRRIRLRTSFSLDAMSPLSAARGVRSPSEPRSSTLARVRTPATHCIGVRLAGPRTVPQISPKDSNAARATESPHSCTK